MDAVNIEKLRQSQHLVEKVAKTQRDLKISKKNRLLELKKKEELRKK